MTHAGSSDALSKSPLPKWVPVGALHYLAHTELGQPIRALARGAGVHASTILRQIRKIETRRDDPLVDGALRRLGDAQRRLKQATGQAGAPAAAAVTSDLLDEATLHQEGMRVLRRLCESGAVLAVAAEMEKAVVVRDTAAGGSTRTAVVGANVAQAMALKEWITASNQGRIVRYHITACGRAALSEMLQGLNGPGCAPSETQIPFRGRIGDWSDVDQQDGETTRTKRMRYSLAESPLVALARRRDHNGTPFLSDVLVSAGERLREDFELGQMDSSVTQNWDKFLTSGASQSTQMATEGNMAASEARGRVAAVLEELGPGLSDVVLRCCCYLEGLETTEKRLGWSARSGKIVLRIALMRLHKHYEATVGAGGPMIG